MLDHGLLYGDGVFEGIRFYHGTAFRLEAHLRRLRASARAIGLDVPWTASFITAAIGELIDAAATADGYLRLIITRGVGRLGIDPSRCVNPALIIIADTLELVSPKIRKRGASLIIAATRRLPPDGLDPRIKSLNYLNHILARIEANHAQADEAILLNQHGHVAEGSADNVFVVRNSELLTPPASDGALAGITREVILELARDNGIPAREVTLAPYDLYTADECFLSGTGAELIPVRDIDGRQTAACPGIIYKKLAAAFRALVAERGR